MSKTPRAPRAKKAPAPPADDTSKSASARKDKGTDAANAAAAAGRPAPGTAEGADAAGIATAKAGAQAGGTAPTQGVNTPEAEGPDATNQRIVPTHEDIVGQAGQQPPHQPGFQRPDEAPVPDADGSAGTGPLTVPIASAQPRANRNPADAENGTQPGEEPPPVDVDKSAQQAEAKAAKTRGVKLKGEGRAVFHVNGEVHRIERGKTVQVTADQEKALKALGEL